MVRRQRRQLGAESRPKTLDVRDVEPLPDEEFWPRLEVFDGRFDGVLKHRRFERELAVRVGDEVLE